MWILHLSITLFAFSSIEVFSKPLMGVVDPFFLTFIRFLIGGSLLVSIAFIKKGRKVEVRDIIALSLIGSLNSVVSMTLLQLSIKYSSASTAATLVASNPIFVLMISMILGNKIPKRKILSIFSGLLGIWLISVGKVRGDSTAGILFGIGASFTFALYTVLLKNFSLKYSPLVSTAYSSFLSSLVYGLLLLMFGDTRVPSLTVFQWMDVLYLGVVVTGVAYLTFFEAVKIIGAVKASMVFFLKPVVATIMAVLILGENLTWLKVIGTAVVIVSLII